MANNDDTRLVHGLTENIWVGVFSCLLGNDRDPPIFNSMEWLEEAMPTAETIQTVCPEWKAIYQANKHIINGPFIIPLQRCTTNEVAWIQENRAKIGSLGVDLTNIDVGSYMYTTPSPDEDPTQKWLHCYRCIKDFIETDATNNTDMLEFHGWGFDTIPTTERNILFKSIREQCPLLLYHGYDKVNGIVRFSRSPRN